MERSYELQTEPGPVPRASPIISNVSDQSMGHALLMQQQYEITGAGCGIEGTAFDDPCVDTPAAAQSPRVFK